MKSKKLATQSVRLSGAVVPTNYRIFLHPDLEAHTFRGEETISLLVVKPAKTITLHSSELAIASGCVYFGKEKFPASKISYDTKSETATFHFDKAIPKGKAELEIAWTGILKDNMRGFYKSRYVVDGTERFMATTQFEATDARRCLPCFDEPAIKATFEVSLAVAPDKMAISNTLPDAVREHEAGYKIISFAPTPKMSTYLLAFIVGDFEAIEQRTNSGVLVRVLTVPGKTHQAKFALDVTARCLEFYESYFQIRYPLDTLDMIAIPDFASLAMENWGAITFREIGLLVDEANTSTSTKELVAEVIAHELAHQWFGNLVTMEWWTHLWLNEGFASYIPYLALTELFPEWNVWDKFATDTLATALKLDALEHTHPIEVAVHHPNEIGEIFDAVSYSKGASVIRMLAEYLGARMFQKGLTYYLKKHSYSNASTVDLWDAFEKVSKKPVKKMMAVWTKQSGYPLVSIDDAGTKCVVSQKRFFSSSASAQKSKDTTSWPIPLSYVTEKGEKQLDLMTKKKVVMPKPNALWHKWNAHEGSLYRVRYSESLLFALGEAIEKKQLSPSDRLGIIRDLFALAEAGEVKTTTVLAFAGRYKDETEYIVWVEIVSGMRYIANLLYGSPAYKPFRAYARDMFHAVATRIGFDAKANESHDTTLLRPLVLGSASFFGDETIIAEALKRFAEHTKNPINPDIRGVIYATVARTGGEKEYTQLLAMYRAETLHEEKNRLLGALGIFQDKKLLTKTLAFTMTDEVRMQDRNGAFASVLVNPAGRALGWQYLKKNWDKIGASYGEGNHLLSRLIQVLNRNTTREAYTDIKTFFKTHSAPAAERTTLQTLENIDSNIRWLARDEKKIVQWFQTQK